MRNKRDEILKEMEKNKQKSDTIKIMKCRLR